MAEKKLWVQGFLYWGYERNAMGKPFTIAWLAMMEPPFHHGKAIRIRQRSIAVHLGICRKAKRPFVRSVGKTPEEIGKWV